MKTTKMTKVHGFKNNVVSNFLQDRYPYLENKNQNSNLSDEVYKSHNSRFLDNMYKIFTNPHNTDQQFHEALLILNEYSNHQEQKIEMIQNGYVQVVDKMLQRQDLKVIYESLRLLGSLASVKLGRQKMKKSILKSLQKILNSRNLKNKECLTWALVRIVSGRDGVNFLISNYFIESMIQAFVTHSQNINQENIQIIVYLLHVFQEILQEDIAILKFTCNNVFQRILELIEFLQQEKQKFVNQRITIIELCVNCLSFMTMNDDGKEEGIKLKAIEKLSNLFIENNKNIMNPIVRIYMYLSITLKGKQQIIECENDFIIKSLIKFMELDQDIEINIQLLFQNLSANMKGFITMVKYLSDQPKKALEIFGQKIIIPIEILLKQYNTPSQIKSIEDLQKINQYLSPVLIILNPNQQQDIDKLQFLKFTIQNTTKFIGQLLIFIVIKNDKNFVKQVEYFIHELINIDKKNKQFFKEKYVQISNTYCDFFETCLEEEIKNYPNLIQYLL